MALIRDGATPAKVARWLQRFGQDAYRLGYEGGYQQGHDAGVEHGYGSAHEEQRSREQLAAVLQHREADQISQGIVEHSADAVQLN
ncbi:MAG TPA: hypothetical protein VL155_18410 [Terriglobales bacterium]|jgi:hypothetical protein|nr:hypothetical protein [Terriglobales bacterium]